MNRGNERRIRRELADIEDARAKGEPNGCGLSVTFNQGDVFDWLCAYTCPQFYFLRGSQRLSPYSGYVIHFQIQFPREYPFRPFKLLFRPTSDLFHPLIACVAGTGSCAAFIHRLNWWGGGSGSWHPSMSVSRLVQDGLLPMWTDGDCWVAEAADPDPYCPCFDWLHTQTSHSMAELRFPHAHPCFEGDMRPFLAQRTRVEANELARELVRDIVLLALDAAAQTDEKPFDIMIEMHPQHGSEFREFRIQVYPSFCLERLQQVVSDAVSTSRV
jgi:ubiquitin-protein ligase